MTATLKQGGHNHSWKCFNACKEKEQIVKDDQKVTSRTLSVPGFKETRPSLHPSNVKDSLDKKEIDMHVYRSSYSGI